MDTLKEKQDYYRYPPSRWQFKEPPELDELVARELSKIGDGRYRFVWGGVAVVRESPDDPRPVVRGDRAATEIKVPKGDPKLARLQPSYLHVKAMQPVAFCWKDDLGVEHRTTRQEFVPPGRQFYLDMEYTDFGKLYWYLERRITPEQALEALVVTPAELDAMARLYPEDHPNHPRRGVWVWLKTLATDDGLYEEPDMNWVEIVRMVEDEFQNGETKVLAAADMERTAKARAARASAEDARAEAAFDEQLTRVAAEHAKQRVYSIPKGN